MKHLLLIGHGFVGKVASKLFRENGWQVTTVSRGGSCDEIADVSSLESLSILAQRIVPPTHILHCASASGGGEDSYRKVYLDGCQNLIKMFPAIPILFTSSTSVYPQVDGSVVSEESSTVLGRETGKILLESEAAVLANGGIVARLAGIYGNGRSYLLRRYLAGEAVMEDQGQRILNHIHHYDAASAILWLLNRANTCGEIFNVCDSQPMSQKETYEGLDKLFNRGMPGSAPRNVNSKRGWSHKAVSNGKLLAMGWIPKYPNFLGAAQEVTKSL